jgi:hypothetical protein
MNHRRSTSAKLRGLQLPEAFQVATIAAAVNAHSRNTQGARASRRRLTDKALRVSERGGR